MLSSSQIVQFANESAERAKRRNLKPYLVRDINFEKIPPFPFPDLGSYIPEGWQLINYFTCDSTGWGYESEPALTVNGLIKKLQEFKKDTSTTWGVGIIESGEFQVVVGFFKPDSRDFTHTGSLVESELRVVGGIRD